MKGNLTSSVSFYFLWLKDQNEVKRAVFKVYCVCLSNLYGVML